MIQKELNTYGVPGTLTVLGGKQLKDKGASEDDGTEGGSEDDGIEGGSEDDGIEGGSEDDGIEGGFYIFIYKGQIR